MERLASGQPATQAGTPLVLDLLDIRRLLGCGRDEGYRVAIAAGGFRLGKRLVVLPEDLTRYLRERAANGRG